MAANLLAMSDRMHVAYTIVVGELTRSIFDVNAKELERCLIFLDPQGSRTAGVGDGAGAIDDVKFQVGCCTLDPKRSWLTYIESILLTKNGDGLFQFLVTADSTDWEQIPSLDIGGNQQGGFIFRSVRAEDQLAGVGFGDIGDAIEDGDLTFQISQRAQAKGVLFEHIIDDHAAMRLSQPEGFAH